MDTSKGLNRQTVAEAAQECLNAQSAVNLSGVVHSFSRAVSTLWQQSEAIEQGTAWVNEHAICALYVDKLLQLSGSTRNYAEDYARVRMLAGHGAPLPKTPRNFIQEELNRLDGEELQVGEHSKLHVG